MYPNIRVPSGSSGVGMDSTGTIYAITLNNACRRWGQSVGPYGSSYGSSGEVDRFPWHSCHELRPISWDCLQGPQVGLGVI